jgi:GH35 family endo-1,4-beta-xylanase
MTPDNSEPRANESHDDGTSRRAVLTSAGALASGLAVTGEVSAAQYWYDGRWQKHGWRNRARRRINNHRKAQLEVTVWDHHGNPVPGAKVDVNLNDHKFNFGTAVNSWKLRQGNGDGHNLRTKIPHDVNYVTAERNLFPDKWDNGAKNDVRWGFNWFNDHGIDVRGHAALWEEWGRMNIDQNQSNWEIFKTVRRKIRERVGEFSGQVDAWDMQNHPYHRQMIRNQIGGGNKVDEVVKWWRAAHNADPNAKMGINEMNIIQEYWGEDGNTWRGKFEWWINTLRDWGVDVEGIGMMAHANLNRLMGIPRALSILDRFGKYGIPIYISEFHTTLPNWQNKRWQDASQAEKDAQREYLHDFLTACFSHPAVDTFTHWEYWDGLSWRNTAALYGPGWNRRDHCHEWRRLINNQWRTEDTGWTGRKGWHSTYGFKGSYKVTVSKNGKSNTVWPWLDSGGNHVHVSLNV